MSEIKKETVVQHLLKKFSEQYPKAQIQKDIENMLDDLPKQLYQYFISRNGPSLLPIKLKEAFKLEQIKESEIKRQWELIGLWFMRYENRPHEAIEIFNSLYKYLCEYQLIKNKRLSKGMPLVWLSDCFKSLGYSSLSRKYLMLTLIEDAIDGKGKISPDTTGVYFRLVWVMGMSNETFNKYAYDIYSIYQTNKEYGIFPEWILLKIGDDWIVEIPSFGEAFTYYNNPLYIQFLLSKTGDKTGKALEYLAAYLMSCMPGIRTQIHVTSKVSDYDVICNMDGFQIDFRSEFGRYFICECKDWKNEKVDFSVFAKFCRILDSVKSKFGIIFSKNGITGKKRYEAAYLEQLKVYQDRGIIVIIIDENDIKYIMGGNNLIDLLRKKYEMIRLDLP